MLYDRLASAVTADGTMPPNSAEQWPAMLAVSLDDLLLNVRVADVLDVALATVVISLALQWLRRRATHAVAIAVVGSVAIYLVARLLGMYLTLAVFQVGLTVFLLVLVIVFQQDIRYEIERLSVSRLFSRRPVPSDSGRLLGDLTEGVALLADDGIGALIVLKGRQPLDRHTRGGVRADSLLTTPLLHSIFSPTSQGHDGAAVIEKDRLASFGVHLPLSTRLSKVPNGGTRHAAALGLSERTDSLVIVVSEERGSISVADGDELAVIQSADELESRLRDFLRHRSTIARRGRSFRSRIGNAALNTFALLIACSLWLVFAFRIETIQQTVADVPVEFRNLPDEWRLEQIDPDSVDLKLTGLERAFGQLDPKELKVSLELRDLSDGERDVTIAPEDVNLPPDITLRLVDAPTVRVNLQRYVRTQLPLRVRTQGELPAPLLLAEVRPETPHWPVLMRSSGPKGTEIVTAPIDLAGITKTVTRTVDLIYPEGVLPAQPDRRLKVTIVVTPPEQQSPPDDASSATQVDGGGA